MDTQKHHITSNILHRQPVYSASLAVFRFLFGIMIFFSMVRFWMKGWIEELYVRPQFFFHYYGFEWVQPWGQYTYVLFLICALSALSFALGLFYRASSILLFLSFTYIELMDKTNYLNHYYFVSLVLFIMIWLPAQASLSLDAWRRPSLLKRHIPGWTVGSIRLMLGIVYVYAGLAKLNSDWLLEAMPLRIWLPAKNDFPIIGSLFNHVETAYFFSWFGAVYDLTIPFLLLNKGTRPFAFLAVVAFHVMTSLLLPIGMFPYIMILSSLIFLDSADVDRFVMKLRSYWRGLPAATDAGLYQYGRLGKQLLPLLFIPFFAFQLVFPWRYLLAQGELFWTEEGYRFSWRVMLMEKMGYAQFVVTDRQTGRRVAVNNNDFLTRNQEKMMATQPDFLIQYAQLLHQHYSRLGFHDPVVNATVYVTVNGRQSRLYVDPKADLARASDSFKQKNWIASSPYTIYGL